MRRSTAAIGSAVYFAVAAGAFAVLVPWLVTGWQFHRAMVLLGGGAGGGHSADRRGAGPGGERVRAVRAGRGTPLPLAPTRRLVVSGFNRYVRNPVYLGSLLIFSGEALLFGRLSLLVYTVIGWAGAAGSSGGTRNPP